MARIWADLDRLLAAPPETNTTEPLGGSMELKDYLETTNP
jgi:hypothetical protein